MWTRFGVWAITWIVLAIVAVISARTVNMIYCKCCEKLSDKQECMYGYRGIGPTQGQSIDCPWSYHYWKAPHFWIHPRGSRLRRCMSPCRLGEWARSSSSSSSYLFSDNNRTKITKIAIQSEGCQKSPTAHWLASQVNKKAQLTLSNPRDVKACKNCSNSTCFVSFHRIPFPRISKFRL